MTALRVLAGVIGALILLGTCSQQNDEVTCTSYGTTTTCETH